MNFWFLTFKYQKNLLKEEVFLEEWIKIVPKFWEKLHHKNRRIQVLNYFVFDEDNWKILRENNYYDFNLSDIGEKISFNSKNFSWKIFRKDEKIFIISKKFFPRENISAVFFKEINYSKDDLLSEFLYSLIFIFWFWIILYFLIYFLVSRNLKIVEKNFQEMEDFVHNAWHELKTPLAVISSNLQIAEKIWKIWDFKELNKENLIEVQKANSLIEWLFSLSQISKQENLEKINLKSEIEKIVAENKNIFSEKDISINTDLKNFDFKISKNHFYILFSNLFFNAIRYSENNWNIKISLKNSVLEISDNWIWISKNNLEKIFDRFFQEGESRESEKWFWIWLSLVKKIADVYWLRVSVESVKWLWTKFLIKF